MALETKLVQKLSQSLMMTPQLQQAIKLLQLGRLEYKEAIERELLENPALEETREESDSQNTAAEATSRDFTTITDSTNLPEAPPEQFETSEPKIDWEDYLESYSDHRGSATPRGLIDHEDRPPQEVSTTDTESLQDHLFEQIRMAGLSMGEQLIAQHIIGNLDRDGYLSSSYEEIAQICGCDNQRVADVAEMVRFLDPIGVGSRNLQECLLTQLEHQGNADSLQARIIERHLEKLEKRKLDQIAKEEGVTPEEVATAVKAIRTLEPRPGHRYSDDTTRYIIPDAYVQKIGNEYVITLNEDGLPKLRVSPYYLDLLRDKSGDADSNKAYLSERLRAAQWLIKSIHQRQQTIYKVTESIMKFQRDFLDFGIDRLKPLVLRDVANDIGMHESTVSRVTTDKYVHTPRGVFELKFFFTSGIKSATGDVSSSSVKERIKQIIAQESSDAPISDQQIVECLKQSKIEIARRTVAKYRETLGIPPSSQRKKLF